jgi:hypothetical protein
MEAAMSALSDFLENSLATAVLRGGAYTGGAVHVALFTSNPTDANSGGEATWAGYARQVAHATVVSDGFTVPANGVSSNTKAVTFPAYSGAGITVTHWGLMSAATGGNLLLHAALGASKTLTDTDVASFPIGSLVANFQ